MTALSSARVSEQMKHASNDVKCSEQGWSCMPWTAGELKLSCIFIALPLPGYSTLNVDSTWFISEQMDRHPIPSRWHQL